MACEDFPCCGHDPGDCPTTDRSGRARWRCVCCGRTLPLRATSSICQPCQRARAQMSDDERQYRDDRQDEYDRRHR